MTLPAGTPRSAPPARQTQAVGEDHGLPLRGRQLRYLPLDVHHITITERPTPRLALGGGAAGSLPGARDAHAGWRAAGTPLCGPKPPGRRSAGPSASGQQTYERLLHDVLRLGAIACGSGHHAHKARTPPRKGVAGFRVHGFCWCVTGSCPYHAQSKGSTLTRAPIGAPLQTLLTVDVRIHRATLGRDPSLVVRSGMTRRT